MRRFWSRSSACPLLGLTFFVALVAVTSSSSATAAAPQSCLLWASEGVRITLLSTNNVDLIIPVTPKLVRRIFDRTFAWCVSQKSEYLGVPGGEKLLTDAWVALSSEERWPERNFEVPEAVIDAEPELAEGASNPPEGNESPAPSAMSVAGFPVGSPEHLAWCRAEYRTWDEETRTVIRQGSEGRRVPCP